VSVYTAAEKVMLINWSFERQRNLKLKYFYFYIKKYNAENIIFVNTFLKTYQKLNKKSQSVLFSGRTYAYIYSKIIQCCVERLYLPRY